VVAILHRLHEQTDDKQGLQLHFRALRALLRNLRTKLRDFQAPEKAEQQPLVLLAESPLEEEGDSVRARLLESVLLLLMVPHTDEGDAAARELFIDFAQEVSRSGRLQRQLGMIQAGGMFLDLG